MTKEIMARGRTTRKLAGGTLRRYFDTLLDAEHEIGLSSRRRLSDTLAREVAQIRVRTPMVVRRRPLIDLEAMKPAAMPAPTAAPASLPTAVATPATAETAVPTAPAAAPSPAFNPYAFSAVALMTRGGTAALMARLETIPDAANLKKLAVAQHLALPSEAVTAEDLRRAILDGVAHRIADRRAAAS